VSGRAKLTGPPVDGAEHLLTPAGLDFLVLLHDRFAIRREHLLSERQRRQDLVLVGEPMDFLSETADVRSSPWRVATIPGYLADRRVEFVGPPDTAAEALRSGAPVWLADLEDGLSPTWPNLMNGQRALYDVIRDRAAAGTIGDQPVVIPRPRGWHLPEKHLTIDGNPGVAALVDAGLFLFHNARDLLDRDRGPALYLPKLESHLEARLWADIFGFCEGALDLPAGSIKATVEIETIWAAFEMDEILYELRDHVVGLGAGRWDYLFSLVKTFRGAGDEYVLPDRDRMQMTAPFLADYSNLLVATAHRRGVVAIGGMSGTVPPGDAKGLERVRADKQREADAGYDGSWFTQPELVPVCRRVFDEARGIAADGPAPPVGDVLVSAKDLLDIRSIPLEVTGAGLRTNIEVALGYLVNWLAGTGTVTVGDAIVDAATAELCRGQLWQWRRNRVSLDGGRRITGYLVVSELDEATERLADAWAERPGGRELLAGARNLLYDATTALRFTDFITVPAYELMP
jgi:malate synthase